MPRPPSNRKCPLDHVSQARPDHLGFCSYLLLAKLLPLEIGRALFIKGSQSVAQPGTDLWRWLFEIYRCWADSQGRQGLLDGGSLRNMCRNTVYWVLSSLNTWFTSSHLMFVTLLGDEHRPSILLIRTPRLRRLRNCHSHPALSSMEECPLRDCIRFLLCNEWPHIQQLKMILLSHIL